MRKVGKMIWLWLLIGALLFSVPVNATTLSDNGIQELEQEKEEVQEQIQVQEQADNVDDEPEWDLTEEELQRELSAVPKNQDTLQTEADGKKYLFLGDSISCGYNDRSGNYVNPYIYYFSQVNSASITNKAIGGATCATAHTPNIMTELEGVNLSDYDAVFILFGVNDFSISCTIGNNTSIGSLTTCGALKTVLNQCNNAGVKSYVILPFPCYKQLQNKPNLNGYYYPAYVNGIKSVCSQFGVTTIDFYSHFGITLGNYANYYVDEVHPNAQLQQAAGYYLNDFLKGEEKQQDVNVNDVVKFVIRLYENCLLREPDDDGVRYWFDLLNSKTISGAQAAEGFFFSKEFLAHNYTDEEFVELLYVTMMNRTSDEEGRNYWVGLLQNGVSRRCVFKGFSESKEFTSICSQYGIERGTVGLSENRDKNTGLTQFVSRLYTKALGRTYDVDGLNYWCGVVLDGKDTILNVSTKGFFHSKEFQNKNLSDGEYIKVLYRTFLDREYDQEGYEYWLKQLKNGKSRDEVLQGFAYSKEFRAIMQKYGL
ncbi:MAG: DUF4214 domain-containing protein [Lachnospiraceae bacterium]|nr:DUF4214 domain-containing protein [Lachnospiraceae bacterium]